MSGVRPSKIIGVGRNYRAHAEELGNPMPAQPILFFKPPTSLIGDGDAIGASFGTAQTSSDTGSVTAALQFRGPESSAITVAGSPAASDTVYFRIFRKVADAGDTMAVDARLHGIALFITTDADTDA